MGKLGLYEYPETTLNDSLAIGRRIAREFMGSVSRSALASALQMSDRGGGFGTRIGSMRIWGIAEGRGTIRLTRNGLRAVNPLTPDESLAARRELAGSVPLFSELARRLGGLPPDRARLGILLEDITGAGRIEIERRLPAVSRVFDDAFSLLGSLPPAPSEPGPVPYELSSEQRASGTAEPEPGFIDIPTLLNESPAVPSSPGSIDGEADRIEVLFPGGRISLPETVASLDVIIQVLQERRGNLARGGGGPAAF